MKICIVSTTVYPCLTGEFNSSKIGGAELQQVYIGRELARRGHQVVYVTADHGQPDGQMIENIKVYKSYRPAAGIPVLRYYYPRLWKIWQALKRADADIYYVRCAGFLPGVLRIFCRCYNKKYIFAGAHDTDFIYAECKVRTLRDKILYRYGLRHADAVIVQSLRQKQLLRDNYNLDGVVIHNFSPLPVIARRDAGDLVLWVSTIRNWKRPLLFIDIARLLPAHQFIMIGGRDDFENHLYEQVADASAALNNVQFLGFRPLAETERYFDRCRVFVNTSVHEGFPNTFLQAWRRGIPVVSFFDPDGVIEKNGFLGTIVSSEEEAGRAIVHYMQGDMREAGEQIRQYFLANYSVDVVEKYESLFNAIFD